MEEEDGLGSDARQRLRCAGPRGQERLQLNREMEMSRQRWTCAGSPGSGSQCLAPGPPSGQQCWAWKPAVLQPAPGGRVVPGWYPGGTRVAPRWYPGGTPGRWSCGQGGRSWCCWGRARRWLRRCFPSSPVWQFLPHWAPPAPDDAICVSFPRSMTEKEVPEPPASPASGGKPKSRVSGCPRGSLGGWGKPPFQHHPCLSPRSLCGTWWDPWWDPDPAGR